MYHAQIEAASFDPEDLTGLRARIMAETLGEYQTVRRGLDPHFGRVRRDIALGYAALAAVLALSGMAGGLVAGFAAAALGAVAIGFLVAYLQLFIHEAAHYNLAADRGTNDRIADRFICWQVGTDIASYRRTHWEHHRSLGTAADTEVSYTNRLSIRFLAEMLTGVHALRVFARRNQAAPAAAEPGRSRRPLAIGAAVHLLLVAGLVLIGAWPAALAWIGGMGIFFPFFATLRQLLEHRPASGEADAAAVNRLFGDGPFASMFGGAGFNRHLLHHMEPQLSYTRLREFEAFLMTTSAREELDSRRTTYGRAFTALVRSDRNG
ncbi:MAG TPA: fatty acid desaturase [Allosphingosinicella sp.]